MSTPILDPSLPADNSPLSSSEMRGRFQAIQNNFDDIRAAVFGRKPPSSAGRDRRRSAELPLTSALTSRVPNDTLSP